MTAELTTRLLSRATNGNTQVTPKQLVDYLKSNNAVAVVDKKVGAELPPIVAHLFITKGDDFDGEKLANFITSKKRAVEVLGEDVLGFITPRCVRKDGSINLRRLKKIKKVLTK